MFKNPFYKSVAKAIAAIVFVVVMCRFTLGGMAVLLALVGIVAAAARNVVVMTTCFVSFPTMVVLNRVLLGTGSLTLLTARFAYFLMVGAAFISGLGARRGVARLPIWWILLYVIVACFSSMDSWMPMISYLKIQITIDMRYS